MFNLASRIMSTLALVAAVLWVAFPAVVVASVNPAHVAGEPCPCCEGQAALGGVISCPGCQVGTPAETALPVAKLAVTTAWLGALTTSGSVANELALLRDPAVQSTPGVLVGPLQWACSGR